MKKVALVLVFCLLFAGIYIYYDSVLMLKPDDGKKLLDDYRGLKRNTVDVITIGSSHVGVNIDPDLLYRAYGIADVNLWSGMQPLWLSYYFAKEALRYQHPKLLVVDTYRCLESDDYGEYQYSVKGVQALSPGLDKVRASLASFEDWKTAAEVVWGMPVYHERYNQLTREDFEYILKPKGTLTDAGVHDNPAVNPMVMPDYSEILDEEPLTEKNVKYLREIISLAKAHNVPLLLITIPYMANETEAKRANTIARIAEEEGVPYINYLKEMKRTGVYPELDFYDTGHMNITGVPKFTRTFAGDIMKMADLPDRRTDDSFTWYGTNSTVQKQPVYQLEEQFLGDGSARYLDTGLRLYENQYASWTLLADLKAAEIGENEVYFSCLQELNSRIHGIMVRQSADGKLEVIWDDDNFTYFDEPLDENGNFKLALVKNVDTYAVYLNGKLVFDNIVLPARQYSGPLMLGCRISEYGGQKYDFGKTRVNNLVVYQEQLTESEIRDWDPDPLPMPEIPLGFDQKKAELIYSMEEQFIGGGLYQQSDHVDTGLKLFAQDGTRFTIMARIIPSPFIAENNVYFSCFAEEADLWRGLLLRAENEDTMSLLLGQIYNQPIPYTVDEPLDLCIIKDGSLYSVYVNGDLVADRVSVGCDLYDGTLLVGCEQTMEGTLIRKSATRVNSLNVYSGVMSDEEILAYDYQDADMPELRTATSVKYRLPDAFMGDGESLVDTGVRLYDVPEKDWTVDFIIMPNYDSYYDVYLSCFDEEAFAYKGFLVRQEDKGKIIVYMGELETIEVSYDESASRMHFVVVKSNDHYQVYVNGVLKGEVVSASGYFDGTLLVGCEQNPDGTYFRQSKVRVLDLTAQDGALLADKAKDLSRDLRDNRFN